MHYYCSITITATVGAAHRVEFKYEQATDDDNDDEEDDDYHDEEEEQEDIQLPTSNMSLSLMRALGMNTTGVEEVRTNWKAPSKSGLEHSARKMHTSLACLRTHMRACVHIITITNLFVVCHSFSLFGVTVIL